MEYLLENNDSMKTQAVGQMEAALTIVRNKIKLLLELDSDRCDSNCACLYDQINEMFKHVGALEDLIERAQEIIPS